MVYCIALYGVLYSAVWCVVLRCTMYHIALYGVLCHDCGHLHLSHMAVFLTMYNFAAVERICWSKLFIGSMPLLITNHKCYGV